MSGLRARIIPEEGNSIQYTFLKKKFIIQKGYIKDRSMLGLDVGH